ncbi:lysis protein, partial [Salmonella enterica]|nr:lysis protein [Salmonella enterica]EKT1780483.1 lysis protein [Salmonella enterica]
MASETISDMQTRQRDVAALDAKYSKELADTWTRILICNVVLLLVAGCASKDALQRLPQPSAPAAWATLHRRTPSGCW